MIIAMVPMRMVQAPIDEVISMVAMRHGFMTTSGTVLVPFAMSFRCATHRILIAYRYGMLVHMIAMWMFEVAVVQIVDVAPMKDCHMTTIWTVLMGRDHVVLLFR